MPSYNTILQLYQTKSTQELKEILNTQIGLWKAAATQTLENRGKTPKSDL